MPENERRHINNKAAITFFLIFLTALLITVPINILITVFDALVNAEVAEDILQIVGHIVSSSIVITDPIFILRNKDLKQALKKLVRAVIVRRKIRS